jgi:hypothetical protein
MAALSTTTPARTGTVTSGAAVAASDTVAASLLGTNGCFLEIINGNASPDTVAISDASTTLTGAAATAGGASVTNATSKIFKIFPLQADTSTGLVTVTHSVTSSVTYKLYPLG